MLGICSHVQDSQSACLPLGGQGVRGVRGAAVVHFTARIINNSCQANLYTLDSFVCGAPFLTFGQHWSNGAMSGE